MVGKVASQLCGGSEKKAGEFERLLWEAVADMNQQGGVAPSTTEIATEIMQ